MKKTVSKIFIGAACRHAELWISPRAASSIRNSLILYRVGDVAIVSRRIDWELRQCSIGCCRCLVGHKEWWEVTTTTSCKVLRRSEDWSWRKASHEVWHRSTCRTFSSHICDRVFQESCARHHSMCGCHSFNEFCYSVWLLNNCRFLHAPMAWFSLAQLPADADLILICQKTSHFASPPGAANWF